MKWPLHLGQQKPPLLFTLATGVAFKGVTTPHALVNAPWGALSLRLLVRGFVSWALDFCVGALRLRLGASGAGALRGCARGLIGIEPFLCVRFTAVKPWLDAGCCCRQCEKRLVAVSELTLCVDGRCSCSPRGEELPTASPSLDTESVDRSAGAADTVVTVPGE